MAARDQGHMTTMRPCPCGVVGLQVTGISGPLAVVMDELTLNAC